MKVRILAFASASEALGRDEVEIELPEGADIGVLRLELVGRFPPLETVWPRLAVAVDGQVVGADARLSEGSEVALLPPVSGGAPEDEVLVDGPIDPAEVLARARSASCGARVLFLGTVRDHHAGRSVEGITYSAYRPMAEEALRRIARELEAEHPGVRVVLVHRLGSLRVGETSTAIAVAAPHRAEGYELNRKALERLKAEVPIWKRERYPDGSAVWREEEPLPVPGG